MKRIAITCLFAAVLLFGCNRDNDKVGVDIIKNPNSAQGYDESEKMPKIDFERDFYDFGQLKAGEVISYSFKFTNNGNADLVISGCDASCGCTVADYPRERIAPGKSGYVTVSFKSSGMSGQQVKEVVVSSNTQPARTTLRIAATVR